eukprot:GDKJ01002127.1.p1 GENE.GDKJ01002127.1~~GDKJ01002127.1.p1  ORF type:complete len:712 (-),score=188.43 GDKJ01002127.1:1388-3499(-)
MSFPKTHDSISVNPDLVAERKNATFNVDAMTEVLYGKEHLKRLARVKKLLAHNPKLDLTDLWHLNKYDRYMRACERAEEIVRLARTYQLSSEDLELVEVMVGEDFFLHLHLTMFLPTLESMCDEEQYKRWVPAAKDFRLFGTYAQTELGHGSNVPGLETTARFDPKTDEWVLDTPTLTSTKWWPGGLAKSCTHCILMAQLIIGEKNYGTHPFLLQIRNLENHESLPGVFLADIGQKLGYNGMDNGCMQLQGVRIPRRNLLMRFCNVDPAGNYKKVGNPKMMYGAMTYTRRQIVMNSAPALAKACTIAVRYSAVRRQFSFLSPKQIAERVKKNEAVPEAPVMDYSTQMFTLLPLVAASYAFSAAAEFTLDIYARMMNNAKSNDFSLLNETHIVTSSLKAATTMVAFDGIEACRKACGGHGYLTASGLPGHLASYAPQPTYEGDFVVLSIQTGRSLLKQAAAIMVQGVSLTNSESTVAYLHALKPGNEIPKMENPLTHGVALSTHVEAFKRRAAFLVFTTAKTFMDLKNKYTDEKHESPTMAALDDVKIEFTRITLAHAHYLILKCFVDKISRLPADKAAEGKVLSALAQLYALHQYDKTFPEFLSVGVFNSKDYMNVLPAIKDVLKLLRPNAIALVDAWNFPDYLLNSTLGRYDGRAYESLFKSVEFDANNKTDVHESYFKHLQYILHPERKVQGSYAAIHTKL